MKTTLTRALLGVAIVLAAACGDQSPAPTSSLAAPELSRSANVGPKLDGHGFGFNGTASGFPTGVVRLTGGGSYDAATASNTVPNASTRVVSSGGFRCVEDVAQGPLAGCLSGEGVRWDTVQLLASAPFKCSATDAVKTAVTNDRTVVLVADFYRAGDGNDESFTGQMIVSEDDLAPLIPGEQHLWVQGVGCGDAVVHFSN
jgi:hypothetical protein